MLRMDSSYTCRSLLLVFVIALFVSSIPLTARAQQPSFRPVVETESNMGSGFHADLPSAPVQSASYQSISSRENPTDRFANHQSSRLPTSPIVDGSPSQVALATHLEPQPLPELSSLDSHLNGGSTTSNIAGDGTIVKSISDMVSAPAEIPAFDPNKTPLTVPDDLSSGDSTGKRGLHSAVSVGTSLLVVVGLFLGFVWFVRRVNPSARNGALPRDTVQVLGRTSLAARHQLTVVQFGPKIVLLSIQQNEVRPLAELEDREQVSEFLAQCGMPEAALSLGSLSPDRLLNTDANRGSDSLDLEDVGVQHLSPNQFGAAAGADYDRPLHAKHDSAHQHARLIAGSLSRPAANQSAEIGQALRSVFAKGAAR